MVLIIAKYVISHSFAHFVICNLYMRGIEHSHSNCNIANIIRIVWPTFHVHTSLYYLLLSADI